ncbi:MAG TPA: hypothetical protein VFW21_08900 [Mycobacterium sp.]|nr:hypothetical protein [Mycobacterium sp.]
MIFAVIRGIHRHQILFPRAGRIRRRCIYTVRAAPIARHATDALADTANAESAICTDTDAGTSQSKADGTALAVPMRPIDFSREIAKPASDASDICIQYADAGIWALGVGFG